jgi:hypothetical protein
MYTGASRHTKLMTGIIMKGEVLNNGISSCVFKREKSSWDCS